ncbi:viral A-type inclusion protein [Planoprotostelium fungivorum]|uniref:Viral A-type inclusion protein n=1 Tax=Planoprotostelium fungivorum TaxID=1890364 RepID=A0A2P6NAR3_9EUKA|nr:viral A-type inclusion protein [Planoprotostelium fungivorum]
MASSEDLIYDSPNWRTATGSRLAAESKKNLLSSPLLSSTKLYKDEGPDVLLNRLAEIDQDNKMKDEAIDSLSYEVKGLEELVKRQEVLIHKLNSESMNANESVIQLKREMETSIDIKSETNPLTAKKQTDLLESLMRVNKQKGRETVSSELYYHVMRLDNESENKNLSKDLRVTEDDLLKLYKESTAIEHSTTSEQKIIILENRVRELIGKLAEMGNENKLLLSIQAAKTNVIQELTEEISKRGATEEHVLELRDKIDFKDSEIADLREELAQTMRIVSVREKEILSLRSVDVGIPYQLWQEDRERMQSQLRNLQNSKLTYEEKIVKQQLQIRTLTERIQNISKSIGTNPTQRQSISPSRVAPRSPSGLSSPKSFRKRPSSLNSPLNSTSDSMGPLKLDFDDDFEERDEVPAPLYKTLENKSKQLESALIERDQRLTEKDEINGLIVIIQMLSKKVDVLTKARSVDTKAWRKREEELEFQLETVKNNMLRMEQELRGQIADRSLAVINLRTKINMMSRSQADEPSQ